MAKISILTLNYNGREVLERCIDSVLFHCGAEDWEWIIKENGSSDGSKDLLENRASGSSKIVPIYSENKGNFSQMNNELLDLCSGDYVLFLNNDVVAKGNFIKEMLSVIENDPEVGGVGAVLYYPDDTIQHCGILFESNCTAHNISSYYMALRDLKKDLHKKDREYQGATAACFLMRKQDWIDIGLFDECYNWCYDDVDLCLKITYDLKKKIVVPAKAELYHYESWSKANPNTWQAVTRLGDKWSKRLISDAYMYSMDYNVYKGPSFFIDLS